MGNKNGKPKIGATANESPALPKIFLSYARDDDEPFVRRLYDDLCERGFTVWVI